ncbi:MAG: PEP-CTERM sorting domain-containing protein [Gloeocapsa sp. DLM2.Bin57]|nr:MAG: PEP-CTERM sorting domain-containing protein [Gloeocapsa sp. DLM2.Bin57]
MPNIKQSISLTVLLGAAASFGMGTAPVEAFPIGAPEILTNCAGPPPTISMGDKCDPNADVVRTSATNFLGLQGNIAFDPQEQSEELQGLRLQGIGRDGSSGEPLFNLDFLPPEGTGEGLTIQANSAPRGGINDFRGFNLWTGTIQDIVQDPPNNPGEPVIPGSPVPSPINPRVRDFIVINDGSLGPGYATGEVDGIIEGGYALDLIELAEPELIPGTVPGFDTTTVRLNMQLQAYKIDTDGNRVEEQQINPLGRTIFANRAAGVIEFSIAQSADEIRTALRAGEIIDFAGTYNILVGVEPDSVIIPTSEVPEPSTIISLLLLGSGTVAFTKRKTV